MIEALADIDDEVATKFLEGTEISTAEIKRAIRRGCIDRRITPVDDQEGAEALGLTVVAGFVVAVAAGRQVPLERGDVLSTALPDRYPGRCFVHAPQAS